MGVTTYGIYLDNCSTYKLGRLKVNAGNGSDGIDGSAGINGIDGADGTVGSPGNECGNGNMGGGPGGNSGAGFPGGNGGDGAPEGDPLVLWPPWNFDAGQGFDGNPGQNGQGPLAGTGGTYGQGNTNDVPSSICFFNFSIASGIITDVLFSEPNSSRISMALSGNCLSVKYLWASFTIVSITPSLYVTL